VECADAAPIARNCARAIARICERKNLVLAGALRKFFEVLFEFIEKWHAGHVDKALRKRR